LGSVDEESLSQARSMIEHQLNQQSTALYATARLWDDGFIAPEDTRTAVALALSAAYSRRVAGTTSFGVFRH